MHRNGNLKKEMVYTFCISIAEPVGHKKSFEEVTHSLYKHGKHPWQYHDYSRPKCKPKIQQW